MRVLRASYITTPKNVSAETIALYYSTFHQSFLLPGLLACSLPTPAFPVLPPPLGPAFSATLRGKGQGRRGHRPHPGLSFGSLQSSGEGRGARGCVWRSGDASLTFRPRRLVPLMLYTPGLKVEPIRAHAPIVLSAEGKSFLS